MVALTTPTTCGHAHLAEHALPYLHAELTLFKEVDGTETHVNTRENVAQEGRKTIK